MNTLIDYLLWAYAGFFNFAWIAMFIFFMWMHNRVVFFQKYQVTFPPVWPRLSVIVPACNEAEHITDAAGSLMAQDYPDLEIIFVNDRSVDNTGEIIDRLAQADPRVKAVHIDTLPDNWLGKVHALHEGVKHASGDWLLFTDADVNYSPHTLRNAIAYVLTEKVDHLTLMPSVIVNSFWLRVVINTFGMMFMLSTRVDKINRSQGNAYVGIGAFNLVNKSFFDSTRGFEWLKMEVADDVGVGLLVKMAGGKTHFAIAEKALSINWYPDIVSMFRGLEKNAFGPGPRYQLWRLCIILLFLISLSVAPALGMLTSSSLLWLLGCIGITLHLVFAFFFVPGNFSDILSFILFPVGLILFSLIMIRAGYKCTLNNGINWRGTHYSVSELKAGQRVKL